MLLSFLLVLCQCLGPRHRHLPCGKPNGTSWCFTASLPLCMHKTCCEFSMVLGTCDVSQEVVGREGGSQIFTLLAYVSGYLSKISDRYSFPEKNFQYWKGWGRGWVQARISWMFLFRCSSAFQVKFCMTQLPASVMQIITYIFVCLSTF